MYVSGILSRLNLFPIQGAILIYLDPVGTETGLSRTMILGIFLLNSKNVVLLPFLNIFLAIKL